MNATTYGLDAAKRVFQMYWVGAQAGEITNRRFGRDDLIAFLAQRPAGRVATAVVKNAAHRRIAAPRSTTTPLSRISPATLEPDRLLLST